MDKIYVLLMHTNTIPSKFVKFFTRYEYSHVAISLEKECKTIYSFGRKSLHNIFNGGFSVQNKKGEFFQKFNNTICKIYEIKVTQEQYQEVKNIINYMENNTSKYKYDFIGIIPRFFKIPITFENKFVCSYFIAYVLDKAQICSFEKDISLVVPKNFENIINASEIYKGKYLKYMYE